MATTIRIGDLLVSKGIITEQQLEVALTEQKLTKNRLGKVLIDKKFIAEDELANLLATQMNLSFVSLDKYVIDLDFSKNSISEILARKFKIIFLEKKDNVSIVGMVEPTDIYAEDEIKKICGTLYKLVVITETDFKNSIVKIYRKTRELEGLANDLKAEVKSRNIQIIEDEDLDDNSPASKLLKNIFEEALAENASDVHIEPHYDELVVRFRIDGDLIIKMQQPKSIAQPLIQRLKILSNLDISEKRLPQDGKFRLDIYGRDIDFRVATTPTIHGESVVLRILNQGTKLLNIVNLKMPKHIEEKLLSIVHHHDGTIIVTGPTGSGKTTTLYALLNEVNSSDGKIITIEDPVEFQFKGISQIQVNEKINLGFSEVLRSVLRQDPDIVMVGEMRDRETVETTLKAAITGHLVLSTLHTNNAASTPLRLIDMGIAGYTIGQALNYVLAQRLIKTNCPHCSSEITPTEQEFKWLQKYNLELYNKNIKFYKGKGCKECSFKGFLGRKGIYELLEMSKELKTAITKQDLSEFQLLAEKQLEGKTLVDNALTYVEEGIVCLEEVIKFSNWA